MRTPIQLFILGILCILAFPALFFEIPLRNKIRNGEIEYPPTEPELTIPANIRYVRTRGVDLTIIVDSTFASYTDNNLFRIQMIGDTMIIEDSSMINKPLIEASANDPDYDDSWSSLTIVLNDFKGWTGIQSNLDLDFHSYEKGRSYAIQSSHGNKLNVKMSAFDLLEGEYVESKKPFDADFRIRLDHLNYYYDHEIHSRNASFQLVHSDIQLYRNDFAKQYRIEADDSSVVVLPHRMIPKVNVKYIK